MECSPRNNVKLYIRNKMEIYKSIVKKKKNSSRYKTQCEQFYLTCFRLLENKDLRDV